MKRNKLKVTCSSSRNTWPQSSQLTEPLWTDLDIKSGIGVCELISIEKKKGGGETNNNKKKTNNTGWE